MRSAFEKLTLWLHCLRLWPRHYVCLNVPCNIRGIPKKKKIQTFYINHIIGQFSQCLAPRDGLVILLLSSVRRGIVSVLYCRYPACFPYKLRYFGIPPVGSSAILRTWRKITSEMYCYTTFSKQIMCNRFYHKLIILKFDFNPPCAATVRGALREPPQNIPSLKNIQFYDKLYF